MDWATILTHKQMQGLPFSTIQSCLILVSRVMIMSECHIGTGRDRCEDVNDWYFELLGC